MIIGSFVFGLTACSSTVLDNRTVNLPTETPTVFTNKDFYQFTLENDFGNGVIEAAVWAPDCTAFALATSLQVDIYDAQTLEVVTTLDTGQWNQKIAYSPDGKLLAIGGNDKTIQLWNIQSKELVHSFVATGSESYYGNYLSFSEDGKRLVSAHHQTIYLWDISTGKMLESFPGHINGIDSVALSPDGDGESSKFHLHINHDGEVVVDADLDRIQVARGLLEAVRGFSLDCPGAESEWEFPHFLIEDFERDLAQGFPAVPVPNPTSIANFVFGHYGSYGGQTYPAFSIWINDQDIQYMSMNDIPRFWWMWFELLEKIGCGDLAAEVVFYEEMEDQYDDHKEHFLMPFMNGARRFIAEATPCAELFRLRETMLSCPPLLAYYAIRGFC